MNCSETVREKAYRGLMLRLILRWARSEKPCSCPCCCSGVCGEPPWPPCRPRLVQAEFLPQRMIQT